MSLTMTRRSRLSVPVIIREPYSPESEFVRKDTFNAHMQRIETLMELNMAEQKAMNESLNAKIDGVSERLDSKIDNVRNELKGDIKAMDERLTGSIKAMDECHSRDIKALDERISSEVKVLNESISHLEDTLTVAINAVDARVDDIHQSQTKWFMLLGVLVAVIPIAVALLQGIIAK